MTLSIDLITLSDLEDDPHPALARLRAAAPVSWVPALGAWLVTGYQLAVDVLRDARTFTVDDPRFSTAKVVGPSMLSLDGARPSPTARISALAPTWPALRLWWPWKRCWLSPACAWTPAPPARPAAWSSASHRTFMPAGIQPRPG